MDPIDAIADGRELVWEHTFTHPTLGELEFRVPRSLRNSDWMRHAATLDRIVREHGGNPDDASSRTTLFASAVAGILELMECPVVDERRTVDPDNEDHEKVEVVRYNPLADENMAFPLEVWGAFFAWRNELIERAGELGKDLGETRGSESDDLSPVATTSPSTTLA